MMEEDIHFCTSFQEMSVTESGPFVYQINIGIFETILAKSTFSMLRNVLFHDISII